MSDGMNHYASDVPWVPPAMSKADLRAFVQSVVRETLEEDARAIRERKEFQPVAVEHAPSGICWACERHGEAEEMMWLDQFGKRSHLVHATEECIRAAELKPEQREHRG